MLDRRTDHILFFFRPFPHGWSKKLPNFAVKHIDLSWDFGHDVPCMGRRLDVNNEGGLVWHKTIFLILANWTRGVPRVYSYSVLPKPRFRRLIGLLLIIFTAACINFRSHWNQWLKRGIGQYFKIFFLAKFHLSCKHWLLTYKYKEKDSKIPSESEEMFNFCCACIKWGWG